MALAEARLQHQMREAVAVAVAVIALAPPGYREHLLARLAEEVLLAALIPTLGRTPVS